MPDFSALMRREGAPGLLAFDMAALAAHLCAGPVEDRKERLRDLIAERSDPALQNTEWIAGESRALFHAIRARGMEVIVARKRGSRYVPGLRTGAWGRVKVPGYAPDRREWFSKPALAC